MARPLTGESFAQCRATYLGYIDTSRELIGVLNNIKSPPESKKLARRIIDHERRFISETWKQLKRLQVWFNQSELGENEPYHREGQHEEDKLLEKKIST